MLKQDCFFQVIHAFCCVFNKELFMHSDCAVLVAGRLSWTRRHEPAVKVVVRYLTGFFLFTKNKFKK